jgi:hypothetical protein
MQRVPFDVSNGSAHEQDGDALVLRASFEREGVNEYDARCVGMLDEEKGAVEVPLEQRDAHDGRRRFGVWAKVRDGLRWSERMD